jgi:hypothetical protein
MSAASPRGPSYDEAVTGWADHLLSGGTTTWSAWLDEHRPSGQPTAQPKRPRPDAVHLELLRRLNLAAGAPVPGLAERVLSTASPGRGLVDVPLPWTEERGYGSPAIDPEHLPEDELIRLAVGVVVHLLPDLPHPPVTVPPARWAVPWRRRFQLHGSPGTVGSVRGGLLAQGLAEREWRPVHVVVARPVEVMMAEHWAASVRAGGILKWTTVWRRAQARGRLPEPIDVATIARGLEGRRREPVHVVVARDAQSAAESTARILGARPFAVGGTADPAEPDLLRRVNRLTALTAGPDRTVDLVGRLAATLDDGPVLPDAPDPPAVPRASLAWAREQAASTAHDLRAAGYAVHGNPDDLAPSDHRHSGSVDRTRTLELAIAACLRTWRLQGGTP